MMFVIDCTITSVVCKDITPEVVSMVVEGGDVGVTSVHVTLTSPFPPAGKTKQRTPWNAKHWICFNND
jgi:hypothetical protein